MSKRINEEVIIDSDDFKVTVEWVDGIPYAHSTVYRWGRGVASRLFERVRLAHEKAGKPQVFTIVDSKDKKLHKYMKMMGFQYSATKWIVVDGEDKIVDIWMMENVNADYIR